MVQGDTELKYNSLNVERDVSFYPAIQSANRESILAHIWEEHDANFMSRLDPSDKKTTRSELHVEFTRSKAKGNSCAN